MINRGLTSKISKNEIKLPKGQSGIVIKSFPCRGVIYLSDYLKSTQNNNEVVNNQVLSDIKNTYEPDSMLGLVPVYYSGIALNEGIDVVTVERLHTNTGKFLEYKLIMDIDKISFNDTISFQKLFDLYPNITSIDFTHISPDNSLGRIIISSTLNLITKLNKKCSLIFGYNQYTNTFVSAFKDFILLGSPMALNISSISLSDALLIQCMNSIKDFYNWITQIPELYLIPSGDTTKVNLNVDNMTKISKTVVFLDTTMLSNFYNNGILNPFIYKCLGQCRYIINVEVDSTGKLTDITKSTCLLLSKIGLDLNDVFFNILISIPTYVNKRVCTFDISINNIVKEILGYNVENIQERVLSIGTWDFLMDINKTGTGKYNLIISNESNEYIVLSIVGLDNPRIILSSNLLGTLDTLYYETDKYTVCSLGNITDMRLKFLLK